MATALLHYDDAAMVLQGAAYLATTLGWHLPTQGSWRVSRSSRIRSVSNLTAGGLIVPIFGPPNVDKLIGRGDVSGLIRALEYQRLWRVRRDAAQALGESRHADAVEPLIGALTDDNTSVRIAAIEALGKTGDSDAVEPLINSLRSQAVEVRKAAADSLGQIGDPRALEPLIGRLGDAGWSVRRAAARALVGIGDPRAAEPLKAACEDSDLNVRLAAVEALAALGWQPKASDKRS